MTSSPDFDATFQNIADSIRSNRNAHLTLVAEHTQAISRSEALQAEAKKQWETDYPEQSGLDAIIRQWRNWRKILLEAGLISTEDLASSISPKIPTTAGEGWRRAEHQSNSALIELQQAWRALQEMRAETSRRKRIRRRNLLIILAVLQLLVSANILLVFLILNRQNQVELTSTAVAGLATERQHQVELTRTADRIAATEIQHQADLTTTSISATAEERQRQVALTTTAVYLATAERQSQLNMTATSSAIAATERAHLEATQASALIGRHWSGVAYPAGSGSPVSDCNLVFTSVENGGLEGTIGCGLDNARFSGEYYTTLDGVRDPSDWNFTSSSDVILMWIRWRTDADSKGGLYVDARYAAVITNDEQMIVVTFEKQEGGTKSFLWIFIAS